MVLAAIDLKLLSFELTLQTLLRMQAFVEHHLKFILEAFKDRIIVNGAKLQTVETQGHLISSQQMMTMNT